MGNVGAFDEPTFTLTGDPAAIHTSGVTWAHFAADAHDTATDLAHLDTAEFQGDEAEHYRTRITGDLPPYLDVTSQAWTLVGAGLHTYADALADLQSTLGTLRATAWSQWQQATTAETAAGRAEAADTAHTADRLRQAQALKPGESPPADTYRPSGGDGRTAANADLAAYQSTLTAAGRLREQHLQAVNACGDTIDRAAALRFADPPGWLGHLWEKACDWVADHIDILQTLSAVLKQISSIAGMLAMIPVLAPLAGPIAAGAGAMALGIDAGIELTTGRGSWTDIALTGASMIPGAKAAMIATVADTTHTGYQVATGEATLTDVATQLAGNALGKHSAHTGKNNALPTTKTQPDWMETKRERLGRERSPEEATRAKESRETLAAYPPESHIDAGPSVRYAVTATGIGDDWATVNNIRKSRGINGHHDVIVHGYVTGAEGELGYFASTHPVHAAQIAEAIRGNPHWQGQPINLVSCGGARGAAQVLADELGVGVYAAHGRVSLDRRGRNVESVGGGKRLGWVTGKTFVPSRSPIRR